MATLQAANRGRIRSKSKKNNDLIAKLDLKIFKKLVWSNCTWPLRLCPSLVEEQSINSVPQVLGVEVKKSYTSSWAKTYPSDRIWIATCYVGPPRLMQAKCLEILPWKDLSVCQIWHLQNKGIYTTTVMRGLKIIVANYKRPLISTIAERNV